MSSNVYAFEVSTAHPDGDIVMEVKVSFRGDVRNLTGDKDPDGNELTRERAEELVAANLYTYITATQAKGEDGEAAEGEPSPED